MVKFVGSYLLGIALLALFTMSSQATFAQKKYKKNSKVNYRKVEYIDSSIGYASFYADKFVGRKTASGELFSQKKLTCAHNTLPLGTMIRVTNLSNQLFVDVKVNDRLNHRNPRIVDLSEAAAKKISFSGKGVIKVRIDLIKAEEKDNQPKTQ
jgi:rare lipoprotein A